MVALGGGALGGGASRDVERDLERGKHLDAAERVSDPVGSKRRPPRFLNEDVVLERRVLQGHHKQREVRREDGRVLAGQIVKPKLHRTVAFVPREPVVGETSVPEVYPSAVGAVVHLRRE